MSFARRVFLLAGIYGLVCMLPQYFLEERIGLDYPPPITHPEHFYGFVGVTVAWQVAFLIIARDPIRYRPLMAAAMLEKITFGAAAVVLFMLGRVSTAVLAFGAVDLILLGLFVAAFARTPARLPDSSP